MAPNRAAALLALCVMASACATPAPRNAASAGAAYADFLVGRFADFRDDESVATDRYLRALARSPQDSNLFNAAIYSALAQGDARQATAIAKLAQERGVDLASARLVRAAQAMHEHRWSRARTALNGLAGDSLEEIAAQTLRIWVEAGAGDANAAALGFERLSAPRPFDGVVAYQRAMALQMAGDASGARDAYARARASGIWLAPAALHEVDLYEDADQVTALYADWPLRLRDPALENALSAKRAGAVPQSPRLSAERAAAIGLYGLAALIIQDPDPSRGQSLLTLSLALAPDLDPARLQYAEGLRGQERYAEARAALAQVPQISPYFASARAATAWLLRREGRDEEALAMARDTLARDGNRLSLMTVADLQRSLEQWDAADAAYTQLIDSIETEQSSDWTLYFSRGAARERLGRFEDAEADLQRALELSPDQPEALNYLGYSWVDRGVRLQEGLALIQRAVEMRPRSGHIVDSLGWAYYRLGDYETALGYLERAVELSPADSVLNDHLGDVLWRVGRRTEARFQWARALNLDPADADKSAIERKLAEGLPPAPEARSNAQASRP
ncbi:MAG: tetratricopeptide repeat protein [Alphaproteobacteria bacterium]|nr:tetratricopeptide repeat protein [Alphaproteobacteria bacterium]